MAFLKSQRTLIGLILICLLVCIYGYYSDNPISQHDLITIKSKLSCKPELQQSGGDMPYYWIEFNTESENKVFCIKKCAYDLVNKDEILNMNSGIDVVIMVNNNEYKETAKKLEVYSLVINGKKQFDLNDFNNCHINYWRKLIPILLILMGIFLYKLIRSKELKAWINS